MHPPKRVSPRTYYWTNIKTRVVSLEHERFREVNVAGLDHSIQVGLQNALELLQKCVQDPITVGFIDKASHALADCFQAGNKVLICGNGGSACDALHFAEEFTGRFRDDRKALPVIPLLESGHLTCVGNDYGFEAIFKRGVEAYGKSGDILVAISTSGNSRNVILAVEAAQKLDMQIILLLGKTGGALKGQGNLEWVVAHKATERIQEIHMLGLHLMIEGVERLLFPENYSKE
jgi:D-sedoheptulose 7-phosphate isomerase